MITHSFVVACLESYRMAEKQIRHMARILPDTWEMVFVDDGSEPAIEIPSERPVNFIHARRSDRQPGEWTQKVAINEGVALATGAYIVKNDIDHVFTREAIAAAEAFTGDMMLFHRQPGFLSDALEITPVEHSIYQTVVDDVFLMKRSIFMERGGYGNVRKYGDGGKIFWDMSRKPEANPQPGAEIYVTPPDLEQYHSVKRYA
jgi:hypothetical protein